MAIRTPGNLYIMELKLDGTSVKAAKQIEEQKYSERFALCNLPIIKVGVNFSTKEKNIESWIIE